MANIKSQIKRNRQNDKRRLRNRVYRGEARTAVKNARIAIGSGDAELSRADVLRAISALDRAAEKGVLHKNNVARRKSRLMKALASMKPVEARIEEPVAAAAPVPEPKKKPAAKAKAAKGKASPAEKVVAKPAKATKAGASKAQPKKPAAKAPAKGKKPAGKK